MKKYLKYIIIVCLIITFIVGILWPGNKEKNINIEMNIKDYGVIKLELYENVAPITVKNFVNLVNDKFYDGLTFHRIIKGFMIQGGDPNKDGTGGSKNNIKGEFTSNGVKNNLKHERGVISMARSNDMNSASSQFFIMQETNNSLDGNYAAFGKVTSGMDVVDEIANNLSSLGDSNGIIDKDKQPVIEYIKVIK